MSDVLSYSNEFVYVSALLTCVSWPEHGNGVLYTDGHGAVKCALLQSICNENFVSKLVTEHGFTLWVRTVYMCLVSLFMTLFIKRDRHIHLLLKSRLLFFNFYYYYFTSILPLHGFILWLLVHVPMVPYVLESCLTEKPAADV
jgi:hypothetical protein